MTAQNTMSSINRAYEILKCLSNGTEKIADISKKLNYNSPTVHKILKSLESIGLVIQDPITRKYFLGPNLYDLAHKPLNIHQALIQNSRDEMAVLRDKLDETIAMQILQGAHKIVIEEVPANQTFGLVFKNGAITPIYAGAVGKVLLSQLKYKELHTLLDKLQLKPLTSTTITDKELLLEDIRNAAEDGHAISFGEFSEGSTAISVPIENYTCPVALGIAGPEERIKRKKPRILAELKESAAKISMKLKKIPSLNPNI